MFTVSLTCPSCGGAVEVSDTTVGMVDSITLDIEYQLRVETIIRHVGFVDANCGTFMQELAREQKQSLDRVFMQSIARITRSMMRGDPKGFRDTNV